MGIQLLPDIVINKLKAGEVVERPASIIKELIENSLDAKATHITIDIHDGGKTLILVQDNGTGIEYADSEMVLHRYATSKIISDEDLDNIGTYGFRGEALASIAEVSKVTIETKTEYADLGFQITKDHQFSETKKISLPFYHGTKIIIQDLFTNTPVRKKFLKSNQTEYFYCYQMCLDFALIRNDIHRTIKKNGKLVHDLPITPTMQSRILQSFKKDREKQLYEINHYQNNIVIDGVISNSTLTFGSNEYCKVYVNGRPIENRAIQKAIMDGYRRQVSSREYPLAIIHISLPGDKVDVNVHPRKSQVKFLDPGAIFSIVKECVEHTIGQNKVFYSSHQAPQKSINQTFEKKSLSDNNNELRLFATETEQIISFQEHEETKKTITIEKKEKDIKIIGQLRESYIIVQHETGIQYIDQHALAERISFEKMKREIEQGNYQSSTLLHPISIQIRSSQNAEEVSKDLNTLQFETTVRGTHTIIIYKVPDFLVKYGIDIEKTIRFINSEEEQSGIQQTIKMETILDEIFASRSCKTSIKAGHKLSYSEMYQLIQDAYTHIPGSFVCQHGRPFCIEIDKKEIDSMFDR